MTCCRGSTRPSSTSRGSATDVDAAAAAILERFARPSARWSSPAAGVRLSGAHADVPAVGRASSACPVVTGWNAHDVSGTDHPLYCGRPGTIGDRGGNMVTQSSDLLLVLGSRLNIRQVSYNWTSFARGCLQDLGRHRSGRAAEAEREAGYAGRRRPQGPHPGAVAAAPMTGRARSTANGWPGLAERGAEVPDGAAGISDQTRSCHPYVAMEAMFDALDEDDVIVTGNGSACVVGFPGGAPEARPAAVDATRAARRWAMICPAAIGVCAATRHSSGSSRSPATAAS